jgi:diguanylate cyclase (GGDEF)-like protein
MEDELRHAAVTDALTGVLNRRGFEEALRQTTAFARRYGHPLSVIAMDLDHFKKVNDLHGHSGGDAVLNAAASLVMQELRSETDFVGRVGGEEFTLLLPHTNAEGAAALAERIRGRLEQHPLIVKGAPVRLTASFGVRQLADDHDIDRLLTEADKALYRAKRAGRNRVAVSRVR